MEALLLITVLGATVLVGTTIGGRYSVAPPVLLIAMGALIGLLPPFDNLILEPEVVLVLFLPAILYRESLVISLREIRANLVVIVGLAVVLVIVTMAAVAFTAQALGVAAASAWVLGAVLAPTDAAAVAGLAKRMPRGILTTLRAESLVNDGTALVLFAVAAGVVAGGTVPGPLLLTGEFVGKSAGGVAAGLLVGAVVVLIRKHVDDPMREGGLSILTPFVAFLLADAVHASGVLAVVVSGLVLSYAAPRVIRARSRVTAFAFWDLSTFMVNGGLFVLLGTQVPRSLRGITSHSPTASLGIAVLVAAVVVAIRLVWVHLSVSVLQRVDRRESSRARHFDFRMRTAVGWAGFRGAVSLAAALAVPVTMHDGTPVRERDLIIFVTVVVIVLIMLVQGTTLPAVVGWAGLNGDRERDDEVRWARIRATEAALEALPRAASDVGATQDTVDRLRADYEDHLAAPPPPGGAEAAEVFDDRHPGPGRTVGDLRSAVRVQVQTVCRTGDLRDEADVVGGRPVGGQRALHADLGGSEFDGLPDQLGERRLAGAAIIRDESGGDPGVQIAVDDEGHRVGIGDPRPDGVGEFAQFFQPGAGGAQQRDPALVVEDIGAEGCRVVTETTQGRRDALDRGRDVFGPRAQNHDHTLTLVRLHPSPRGNGGGESQSSASGSRWVQPSNAAGPTPSTSRKRVCTR